MKKTHQYLNTNKEYFKLMKKRFNEMKEPVLEIYINEDLPEKNKKNIYETISKYLENFNEKNKTCFWLDSKNKEILSANFKKENLKIYESLIDFLNSKGIETGLSESKLHLQTKKLFESELEKAEITLAIQTIIDSLQKTIKNFSDITYNDILNISEKISKNFSKEITDHWQSTAINLLNELIDKTIETKEKFNNLAAFFEKKVEKENLEKNKELSSNEDFPLDLDNEDTTDFENEENNNEKIDHEEKDNTELKRKLKDDINFYNLYSSKNFNLNRLEFAGKSYIIYENAKGYKLYDPLKKEMIEFKNLRDSLKYINENLNFNKFTGDKSRIEKISEIVNRNKKENKNQTKNKKLIRESISEFKNFFKKIKNENIDYIDDNNNLVFDFEKVFQNDDFCLYKLCYRENVFFIIVNKDMKDLLLIYNGTVMYFSDIKELFNFCLDCCKNSNEIYKNNRKLGNFAEPLYDVYTDVKFGIDESIAIKNAAIRYNLNEKILKKQFDRYVQIIEQEEQENKKNNNKNDDNIVVIDKETEKDIIKNLNFILNLFYTKGAEFIKFETIYDFLEKEFDFLKNKDYIYKNILLKYISNIPNMVSSIKNNIIYLNKNNNIDTEKYKSEKNEFKNFDVKDLATKKVKEKIFKRR